MNEPIRVRQFRTPVPARMQRLPVDRRGYPIPKFVEWIEGEPDFRIMSARHFKAAVTRRLCWICGEPLGRNMAFVMGPMCCITRVNSEPPSHLECAEFAAVNCPFLAIPTAKRRDANMPEDHYDVGFMIARNPGVTCIWVTRDYTVFAAHNGVLIRVGEPDHFRFYAHGRPATRAEIDASIESGFPALLKSAKTPGAVAELCGDRVKFEEKLKVLPP